MTVACRMSTERLVWRLQTHRRPLPLSRKSIPNTSSLQSGQLYHCLPWAKEISVTSCASLQLRQDLLVGPFSGRQGWWGLQRNVRLLLQSTAVIRISLHLGGLRCGLELDQEDLPCVVHSRENLAYLRRNQWAARVLLSMPMVVTVRSLLDQQYPREPTVRTDHLPYNPSHSFRILLGPKIEGELLGWHDLGDVKDDIPRRRLVRHSARTYIML